MYANKVLGFNHEFDSFKDVCQFYLIDHNRDNKSMLLEWHLEYQHQLQTRILINMCDIQLFKAVKDEFIFF